MLPPPFRFPPPEPPPETSLPDGIPHPFIPKRGKPRPVIIRDDAGSPRNHARDSSNTYKRGRVAERSEPGRRHNRTTSHEQRLHGMRGPPCEATGSTRVLEFPYFMTVINSNRLDPQRILEHQPTPSKAARSKPTAARDSHAQRASR